MDLISSTCSRTCLNVCLQTRVILGHTMSYFCLMIVIRLWPASRPKATTCHRSRHVPSVPNGTCRTFCANFESCNLSSRHIFCGMQGMKPPNQQQTNAKNMASCTSDPTCTWHAIDSVFPAKLMHPTAVLLFFQHVLVSASGHMVQLKSSNLPLFHEPMLSLAGIKHASGLNLVCPPKTCFHASVPAQPNNSTRTGARDVYIYIHI